VANRYRLVPTAEQLPMLNRYFAQHRAPFSWSRRPVTWKQRGTARTIRETTKPSIAEIDSYYRRLSLWHAGEGENPDLTALRLGRR